MRCIEVATRREVVVLSGADGWQSAVTYRYTDDRSVRTVTREAFFLNGYYVASTAKEPTCTVR